MTEIEFIDVNGVHSFVFARDETCNISMYMYDENDIYDIEILLLKYCVRRGKNDFTFIQYTNLCAAFSFFAIGTLALWTFDRIFLYYIHT